METQFKPGSNGGAAGGSGRHHGSGVSYPAVAAPPAASSTAYRPSPFYSSSSSFSPETMTTASLALRGAAALLTFVAAVVIGAATQSKTVTVVGPSFSPITLSGTVKGTDSSAFVYFVIVNVLVSLYSAAALAATAKKPFGDGGGMELVVVLADIAVVVFLQSCNGAAANTSAMAEHGSWRLGWGRICNIVGRFCGQAAAAIVLSMLAAIAYLALVVIAVVGFHRRAM